MNDPHPQRPRIGAFEFLSQPRLWTARQRLLAWIALPVIAALAATFAATSQTSPPAFQPVALSSDPLYANTAGDKPTLALALSVEFPTVGAQYVSRPGEPLDDSYSNGTEYLGYYDSLGCYTYNDAPTEAPAAGLTAADYKRFDRSGAAINRTCANAFSGNFLNWASNSAIDMLRLALSGGDRYIDTPDLTILQRAVIPDGDPICMWNSANFPAKQLQRGNAAGAVPVAMITAAGANDIWVGNTLNRIYFGTTPGGDCGNTGSYALGGAAGLNSDGFFYARVRVCDKDAAGNLADDRDYKLCTKYASGNYKPTGTIQKYSDELRMAAFGYLLDQSSSASGGRYGGVLRAPMKYLGAKTFDINGQDNTPAAGNAGAEWDLATGVFKTNPDNDPSFGISGVVNYLNKFGRTGLVPGRYKQFDPISELYYESLRYLQGLPPSPDAVSAITTEMYDGFPVANWTDPYGGGRTSTGKYACLKSNIVVIGDANTQDGSRFPAASAAANIPDFGFWTGIVGSFESGATTPYFDGQGVERFTGNPNAANGNAPSDAIIGYSYWAHTHDIRGKDWTDQPALQRPGLRVKTFVFDVNEFGQQSDPVSRRYANHLFTTAKYGGFETAPSDAGNKPYNTYGNPFKREDGTPDNNVWQDPASPGDAAAYYLQSSARGVLKAFDSIFSRSSAAARSIAGGAIGSRALTQAGSTIYQGAFDTGNWSGDLLAFPVNVDANNNVTISPSSSWSASARLAALTAPATTRNIVIGNAGAASTPAAFDFSWAAIPAAIQADLDKPAATAAPDGQGQLRLAYLRGDASKEGTLFRPRNDKLLGDIINSGVAYSGAPSTAITSTTYAAFSVANAGRTPAVFVGANDGMLHAFNANTGDELFGYIPSWLSPKLSALTGTTYVNNHQSYVDAPPVVAEAQVGSTDTAADWKTVLVSGAGAGGRGVFTLDVTDPAAFSAAKVMWEFTSTDDPDLGFVVGQPQIVKMRTSAPGVTPTYKWFAMVAGGVNNYLADSAGNFSQFGNPTLFLLDLAKPAATAWILGVNYHKVALPVNAALAATTAPGVINFKTVLGPTAREVTQVFAGDLHGNLWKLDFRPHGNANWNMNALSAFSNGTPYPLYIARDAAGAVQPISMAPSLVAGQTSNSIYVAFGTGKYLEAGDQASLAPNSFYVVHDNGSTAADNNPAGASVISGRGRLAAGTLNPNGTVDVPTFVWGRATGDGDTTQRSGWYFDYSGSGERQISGATLAGDTLIFGSLIPGATAASNVCGVAGGGGNQYRVNIDSGDGAFTVSNVGILGQPLVTEITSATTYSKSDSTGRRIKTISSQVFNQGSGGIDPSSEKQVTTMITGRLSWRQINNYQDLKNAP